MTEILSGQIRKTGVRGVDYDIPKGGAASRFPQKRPAGFKKRRKLGSRTSGIQNNWQEAGTLTAKGGISSLRGSSKGQVSLPGMAAERMRRIKEANETRGKGEHFGKHTGFSQVIHPTNVETANRPRVDFGKTDFYSSTGGNPAVPNHRPFNKQAGTYPISPLDSRKMLQDHGALKIAKQHKS